MVEVSKNLSRLCMPKQLIRLALRCWSHVNLEWLVQDFQGQRMPCSNTGEHSNSDCVCMPCQCCPKWHHVYVTKRPRSSAYYCQDCRR